MLLRILCVLGLVGWVSSGGDARTYAAQSPRTDYARTQSEFDRLQPQYKATIQEWRQAGQDHLPSLQSPLVDSDALSVELPPECIPHLQEEKAKLEREAYSNEAWLHHVFKCDMCCAPLLASMLEHHVAHVVANPHLVVLFDFDTYELHERYRRQLDALMRQFDPARDQILLIGRASRTGTRAYNIILSGNRAGAIKDYVIDHHAADEAQIHYLFFGYDPPQLTPAIAKRYGVTADDLAAIDPYINNSAENKMNQSVVVILYKNHGGEKPTTAPRPVAVEEQPQPSSPAEQIDAIETPAPASQQAAAEAQPQTSSPAPAPETPAVATEDRPAPAPNDQGLGEFPALKRSGKGPQRQMEGLVMVTGALASTSFVFAQEIVRVAQDAGIDVAMQQSDGGGIDTVQRLLQSDSHAVGIVQADVLTFLSRSPDPDMNRVAEQLRLLFSFYNEDVHLFARKAIQGVGDLNGKRVVMGMRGSGNWLTAHNMLHIFKVQPAEMIDDLPPIEAIVAVLTGTADAMFYVEDKPAASFVNLRVFQSNPQLAPLVQEVHFVPLHLPTGLQDYTASTIGPDDYSWVDTTIPTLAVKMILTGLEYSEPPTAGDPFCTTLATLGQAIHNNLDDLQHTGHPKWQEVDLKQQLASWKRDACTQSIERHHDQNGTPVSKRQ